jgi:hypothetical protein
VTISPAHSGTLVQESGEILTAETRLQPIHPKSDRLLDHIRYTPPRISCTDTDLIDKPSGRSDAQTFQRLPSIC